MMKQWSRKQGEESQSKTAIVPRIARAAAAPVALALKLTGMSEEDREVFLDKKRQKKDVAPWRMTMR